ncbi:MAG: hydrogenase expression/formation protein [Hydrogenophilales bacterium]|nr:hydrogenase expression/formation protein [Hydrogenophilales bacterium]
MGLESIPVVTQSASDGLTGNAAAVLREIAARLESLAKEGQSGIIDLGAMPLSPADKAWLADKLGQGEVEINLELDGPSHVRETRYAGVWWLLHHNPQGAVTGEFIEITRIPELVLAHPADIISGSESLNFLIDDLC